MEKITTTVNSNENILLYLENCYRTNKFFNNSTII